jgi:hypothetical protein
MNHMPRTNTSSFTVINTDLKLFKMSSQSFFSNDYSLLTLTITQPATRDNNHKYLISQYRANSHSLIVIPLVRKYIHLHQLTMTFTSSQPQSAFLWNASSVVQKDGNHWMQGLDCMVDGQHVLSETGPQVFLWQEQYMEISLWASKGISFRQLPSSASVLGNNGMHSLSPVVQE